MGKLFIFTFLFSVHLFAMAKATQTGLALQGSWYNSSEPSQGVDIQHYTSSDGVDHIMAFWVTYDPTTGKKLWMSGEGPVNNGVAELELWATKNGSFRQSTAQLTSMGYGKLTSLTCSKAVLSYTMADTIGSDMYKTGSLKLSRLTPSLVIDDHDFCEGLADSSSQPATPTNYQNVGQALMGTWYNPAENFQGLSVQYYVRNGGVELFLFWMTYDDQGRQVWLTGESEMGELPNYFTTVRFKLWVTGDGKFRGATVDAVEMGTATLIPVNCEKAFFYYRVYENNLVKLPFATGQIILDRLTPLHQFGGVPICQNGALLN